MVHIHTNTLMHLHTSKYAHIMKGMLELIVERFFGNQDFLTIWRSFLTIKYANGWLITSNGQFNAMFHSPHRLHQAQIAIVICWCAWLSKTNPPTNYAHMCTQNMYKHRNDDKILHSFPKSGTSSEVFHQVWSVTSLWSLRMAENWQWEMPFVKHVLYCTYSVFM